MGILFSPSLHIAFRSTHAGRSSLHGTYIPIHELPPHPPGPTCLLPIVQSQPSFWLSYNNVACASLLLSIDSFDNNSYQLYSQLSRCLPLLPTATLSTLCLHCTATLSTHCLHCTTTPLPALQPINTLARALSNLNLHCALISLLRDNNN